MRKIIIYTDGGAIKNPGPAAIAFLFCNERKKIFKKFSQYIGEKTNNEAEYQAAILALQKLKSFLGKKLAKVTEVEIRSDSELLVNQMTGKYKILEERLQPLFLKLWNLKLDFKKVKFKLISRRKNKEADKLVKEVLSSLDKKLSFD
jgi:ribonuclease HI